MERLYLRNNIPFLPLIDGENLAKESLIKDIEENFDLRTFVSYHSDPLSINGITSDHIYLLGRVRIEAEELVSLISNINHQILSVDFAEDLANEVIDDAFLDLEANIELKFSENELQFCCDMKDKEDIVYKIVSIDDDMTDEAIELLSKLDSRFEDLE